MNVSVLDVNASVLNGIDLNEPTLSIGHTVMLVRGHEWATYECATLVVNIPPQEKTD